MVTDMGMRCLELIVSTQCSRYFPRELDGRKHPAEAAD